MDDDDHDANRTRQQHAQKPEGGPPPHRRGQRLAEGQGHGPVGGTVADQEKAQQAGPQGPGGQENLDRLGRRNRSRYHHDRGCGQPGVWDGCECDLEAPAVYVHRLVTARAYGGRGLGAQLIDWAGIRGHLLHGAEWIRIDVWTDNAGLHQYYKMAGFEPCGFCSDPGYPSGALFQKPITEVDDPAIPQAPEASADFGVAAQSSPYGLAQLT